MPFKEGGRGGEDFKKKKKDIEEIEGKKLRKIDDEDEEWKNALPGADVENLSKWADEQRQDNG